MFKHQVSYTNFDGKKVKEELWFHLSTRDIVPLTEKYGDLQKYSEKLLKEKKNSDLLSFYEDLITTAYGERSEDGKRFIRNEKVRSDFFQSLAFDALLDSLLEDEKEMDKFFGALAAPLQARIKKLPKQKAGK